MNLVEDKDFGGNKPFVDLTNVGQWGQTKAFAKHIGKKNWLTIENHVKERVNGTCELCNANETKKGTFGQKAHKFRIEFKYTIDTISKVATLHRLMYVCVSCSQMIHLRQTELQGQEQYNRAIERLCQIHNLKPIQIVEELDKQLDMIREYHERGIPENLEVYIIEDGLNRLWK